MDDGVRMILDCRMRVMKYQLFFRMICLVVFGVTIKFISDPSLFQQ